MPRSRGQIILVSAFALAVTFLSLALVLNTAIYTQSLATRETVDGYPAVDLRLSAGETGEFLLRAVNDNQSIDGYEAKRARFERWITRFSHATNTHALTRGTLRNVTVVATHPGTAIRQPAVSSYPNGTFEVASGVSDVRRARFTVTDGNTTTPLVIRVTNGSRTWTMKIWETSAGAYDVTVHAPTGTETRTGIGEGTLRIRPTNGTYEGTEWPILRFQDRMNGSYTLFIENGSVATGTFRLTVNEPKSELEYETAAGVQHVPVVYNATLAVRFASGDLTVRTNVTVAPEGRATR
ncbi:MAG: hypothetical protein ABEJ60_00170 [Halodesulfurarchaeum sp.]